MPSTKPAADEAAKTEEAPVAYAPDAAVAVAVADLVALVEHARATGADELADRIKL